MGAMPTEMLVAIVGVGGVIAGVLLDRLLTTLTASGERKRQNKQRRLQLVREAFLDLQAVLKEGTGQEILAHQTRVALAAERCKERFPNEF
jgi:hypothetical protein